MTFEKYAVALIHLKNMIREPVDGIGRDLVYQFFYVGIGLLERCVVISDPLPIGVGSSTCIFAPG